MVKGKFERPIMVSMHYLKKKHNIFGHLHQLHNNGFTVSIQYTSPEQKKHFYSGIEVRYYGTIKEDMLMINSFSYSVQHLPVEAQKEINKSPYRVAKHGLEVVGVSF